MVDSVCRSDAQGADATPPWNTSTFWIEHLELHGPFPSQIMKMLGVTRLNEEGLGAYVHLGR
jgi:hypothetical protein